MLMNMHEGKGAEAVEEEEGEEVPVVEAEQQQHRQRLQGEEDVSF